MSLQAPHADCPACHGTGECANAQFRCHCRWHRQGCALVTGRGDCDCRPVSPQDTSDTTCDNDVGRTCRELWPDVRDSWCEGCLNLTRVDAAWLAALEAAQPVLRRLVRHLEAQSWEGKSSFIDSYEQQAQAVRAALLPPTELE